MTKPPEAAVIAVPEHLSDRSKAIWLAVVPARARSAGRLALVQTALESLDRADEARLAITTQGLTSTTESTKAVHLNPLLKFEREARGQFAKIWGMLGLEWDQRTDGMTGK